MPANHELTLTRLIDAPRAKLFRCFREPDLLKQWFAPKPYTVPIAELDFRVGGASRIVMRSPEGQDIPAPAPTWRSSRIASWYSRTPTWVTGNLPASRS
jgi:uncharacterized protein YndB with AHSA1/START domain